MTDFTRKYPQGRIDATDEGQTEIGLAYDEISDRIVMNFFRPMKWIALDAASAGHLIGLLHSLLGQMKAPIQGIQESVGTAFSNDALTAAATSLVGASEQIGQPLVIRLFPEGDRGLSPGQSQTVPDSETPHPDCLGLGIGVSCTASEAYELTTLITKWQDRRLNGRN